jgi:hypothetical protein
MNPDLRRELISKNLGIKPINHGQVYTFQIALPDSRKQDFSLEQRQAIEQSLLAHQSNLISLIIRRIQSDDEDIEYELVYGADWLQIAQELGIEKVWAWVFDLTDEQAIATIAEMESLAPISANASQHTQPTPTSSNGIDADIAALIDKKLQFATDSIRNSITSLFTGIRNDLDEKLKALTYKIDHIGTDSDHTNRDSTQLASILEKLDTIQQQLKSPRRTVEIEPIENPINLLEASDQEIEAALKQVGGQDLQIKGAIAAVRYWRQSEQGLTWKNLESSAKAKKNSPHKIDGFAKGTHDRLLKVGTLPE